MTLVQCPECTHEVSSQAATCPHCGISIASSVVAARVPAQKSRGVWTRKRSLGDLLVLGGIGTAAYYYMYFDTSVEVQRQVILGQVIGGGRVNNLGLMADRQNGILVGLALIVIGVILSAVHRRKAG